MKRPFFAVVEMKPRPTPKPVRTVRPKEPPPKLEPYYPPESRRWGGP